MATELDTELIGRIWQGDCLDWLAMLPDNSAHCCITSPPYWGLRDYQTARWQGGDPDCDHASGRFQRGGLSEKQRSNTGSCGDEASGHCPNCGAIRVDRQIGLEATPEEYVEKLVAVFREVRRVLRHDGVCFLNMGDSYNGSGGAGGDYNEGGLRAGQPRYGPSYRRDRRPREDDPHKGTAGLKPKDLCGIPWRLALALQAAGWWLRSDVIWRKPNPMPESVTDRPTRSHEYVFLLTKSARYWYDADAVREAGMARLDRGPGTRGRIGRQGWKPGAIDDAAGRNLRSVWTIATEAMGWEMCAACKHVYSPAEFRRLPRTDREIGAYFIGKKLPGSSGVIPKATGKPVCQCGSSDSWLSHFATFPTKLVARCLEAGCPHKVCAECGAPWVREVERSRSFESGSGRSGRNPVGKHGPGLQGGGETRDVRRGPVVTTTTLGFLPTCSCGGETEPGLLIDPFAGSGTALMVAERLGRRHAGCDLNGDYVKMAEERIGREREQKQLALEH